jgi:hypothetical protein
MKITAQIYEHFEGSDDPRAIQGGGGAGSRCIETRRNSRWLIKAYVAAMARRYDETFTFRVVG